MKEGNEDSISADLLRIANALEAHVRKYRECKDCGAYRHGECRLRMAGAANDTLDSWWPVPCPECENPPGCAESIPKEEDQ